MRHHVPSVRDHTGFRAETDVVEPSPRNPSGRGLQTDKGTVGKGTDTTISQSRGESCRLRRKERRRCTYCCGLSVYLKKYTVGDALRMSTVNETLSRIVGSNFIRKFDATPGAVITRFHSERKTVSSLRSSRMTDSTSGSGCRLD